MNRTPFNHIKLLKATLLGFVLLLSGCFKDFKEEYLFTDLMVEIDAATWESQAPGKTFPVLGPLEKGSGIQQYQVNLIGPVSPQDQELQIRVVPEETTAQEGHHFRLKNDGKFILEANQSEAYFSIEILDFPAESGLDTLVVELVGTPQVKVSENYKRLGWAITLTGPPSETHPLHEQLGPENYYNSIYLDPLNLNLPADTRQRLLESAQNLANFADGTRRLQFMYIYFDQDDLAHVVAQYFGGGGNSLTASAYAIWTYKLVLDENGVGQFEFVEANGNGNGQKNNFAPILADYLEKYTFKVDWTDPALLGGRGTDRDWGGLYRVDDPSSFLFGTLEALSPTGSVRPLQQADVIREIFQDGPNAFFTTLFIDPDDPAQSASFREKWQQGVAHIEGIAGRQLFKMMFYFNPAYSFQDVRIVNYYYSSSGGRFIGQIRNQFRVNSDGIVQPFSFIFQDGNGGATRAPQVVDQFLMAEEFTMTRTGQRVRFTSKNDPELYFEGELGNHPLNISQFWPE